MPGGARLIANFLVFLISLSFPVAAEQGWFHDLQASPAQAPMQSLGGAGWFSPLSPALIQRHRTLYGSQRFSIRHGSEGKVLELLRRRYPELQISPLDRAGFLASGTRWSMQQMQRELANLDRPKTVRLRIRFGDDPRKVRTALRRLLPGVKCYANKDDGSLLVEGRPHLVQQAEEMLTTGPLDQVVVDLQLGVRDGRKSSPNGGPRWSASEGIAGNFGPATLTRASVPWFSTGPRVHQSDFAKILARPRSATRSGRALTFYLGDKFSVRCFDGRAGQFYAHYVDVGCKLDLKPEILDGNQIRVDLRLEVTTLSELINSQYPRQQRRVAATSAVLREGQTLSVEGLLPAEDLTLRDKLSPVRDLPVAGTVFGTEGLSLAITPRILR